MTVGASLMRSEALARVRSAATANFAFRAMRLVHRQAGAQALAAWPAHQRARLAGLIVEITLGVMGASRWPSGGAGADRFRGLHQRGRHHQPGHEKSNGYKA